MVHYPTPKYVKASHLRNVRPFNFRAEDKRADRVATIATCLRCAQTISNQRRRCRRPESRRCAHCTDGNRGNCALVPGLFNGRVNRLYELRTIYDNAVAAATTPRTNAAVISSGVKLARAQRAFNLDLSHHRRQAAHTGTPVGVPTLVPTTTPNFLSLILVEQRRIAVALEQLVGHVSILNGGGNNGEPETDSDDGGGPNGGDNPDGGLGGGLEDGNLDEGNGRGAIGAPDGRIGDEGEEHANDDDADLDAIMND